MFEHSPSSSFQRLVIRPHAEANIHSAINPDIDRRPRMLVISSFGSVGAHTVCQMPRDAV
jgi:hypothetical protein